MIRITLPFPPSVNSLYAGYGRRHKSKRYEAWILAARTVLWNQVWEPLRDCTMIEATYRFGRPDKRRRDVANFEKGVSDLLVSQQVIGDDSMIERIVLEWKEGIAGVEIELKPFKKAAIVGQIPISHIPLEAPPLV